MKVCSILSFLLLSICFSTSAQETSVNPSSSIAEIKDFIRSVMSKPLAPEFIIPDYILNASDPEAATAAINLNYPEFVGKEGPEFMRAIAKEPARYQMLMSECKAVRIHFKRAIEDQSQR